MKMIWFLLRSSWLRVAIAALTGSISGACSASLIALINNAIGSTVNKTEQLFLVFMGLAIVAFLTNITSQYLLSSLSYNSVYELRLKLSNGILDCPLRHLEEIGANRIIATLTEDTEMIGNTISSIPFFWIDMALILGCLVYLYWLSWVVFLVTAIALTFALVLLKNLSGKAHELLNLARKEQDNLFKHFRTITDGIKELKLNSKRRQAFVNEELKVTAAASRYYDIECLKLFGISNGVGQLLFLVIVGLLVFGLPKITPVNATVLSGYVLVITYLTEPLQRAIASLPQLTLGSVALHNIEKLGLSLASRSEAFSSEFQTPLSFQSIELIGISHTYGKEQEESFTLGPIDLKLYPGEIIFIVGGNGSGKSTLAKLIAGLYIPDAGAIYLDGNMVSAPNLQAYRQLFSTVFYDFYLFERLLGIDLEDLDIQAHNYLKKLQLDQKMQIKNGRFSTIELSQGQRKRLALLTAYLEDRPIYLFDEWAADQDPHFREIFYKQLLPELKQRGKTVLVISHDDRYFDFCDRIIKLDYGKVVEPN